MGYPITIAEDYAGVTAITSNKYDVKQLEAYILTYEKCILQDLLGCEMESELIADLDANNEPISDKFKLIFNEFCKKIYSDCSGKLNSSGIKELLIYQLFFLYTRDQQIKNTVVGNVKNNLNVWIIRKLQFEFIWSF